MNTTLATPSIMSHPIGLQNNDTFSLSENWFSTTINASLLSWNSASDAPENWGIVKPAARRERVALVELKGTELELRIAKYEKAIGMSVDELIEKEKAGDAPDSFQARYLSAIARMR